MIVTASTLNVRSGPGTTFRILSKVKRNDTVEVHERSGDWVWISPGFGWVNAAYLAEKTMFESPPLGREGIEKKFGSPGSPQCYSGRARFPAPVKLSWEDTFVTAFACHAEMEAIFTHVFHEIYQQGLWNEIREFGGCYNNRETRAGGKKSTHAWGIAVDLNPDTNQQGTDGDMHPEIVRIFEENGFTAGIRFGGRSKDPMHFQYARGY